MIRVLSVETGLLISILQEATNKCSTVRYHWEIALIILRTDWNSLVITGCNKLKGI